ncbi:unnamed protein product [Penicillium bialowiezense]
MSYQPAIMSASLGRAWLHDLDYKLEQASKVGFKGIEIFYEDLDYCARKLAGNDQPSADQLLRAAEQIQTKCQSQGLEIIALQPFLFYEGLKDREQHARLVQKMELWLQIVKRLKTNTIQIPANFLPADQLTNDIDVIVADLRQLADMGAAQSPVVRYAYENLCWSTVNDTWEKAWEVVKRVDRPNFGICLDTFNIAGKVWADPASPTGKTANGDVELHDTIQRLVAEVDLAKVFYLQVVDAERMESPLVPGHPFHIEGQPSRMSWSRNARTFMYEEDRGAYMPVEKIARAIVFDLGYKGTMSDEGKNVPDLHAQRGIAAWAKLQERLQLE